MIYDTIIIGAGPAGYSAAIYATRYGMKTLIIGQNLGGMATSAHQVDNYPGFPSISGFELMQKFSDHAKKLGAEIVNNSATSIIKGSNKFNVQVNNLHYSGKSLILALGTQRRKMNIPGEKEFLGRGVSYCATCDAMFYKNKIVAVIGGGDAALQAALQLAEIATKVYLIFPSEKANAMPHWLDQANKYSNKIIQLNTNTITQINGKDRVKSVTLKKPLDDNSDLMVAGVFIEIGAVPNSVLVKDIGVNFNDRGYIVVNNDQSTNIDGIFAAGDITTNSAGFAQIITATSEGALAAFTAFKYLKQVKK
ncbi:MAG: thioredoxin-disulfide reductase [uncultured bacterium]|nr:MAG: thioredoxin-disulfide reductase [uncultured bacterium]